MKLTNKVAIVAGGGRDIGRAISLALASEGAKVAITYCHSSSEAEATAAEIKSAGGEVLLVQADLTKPDAAAKVLADTQAKWGAKLDILINVTGGLVALKTLSEMDADFFNHVMELNVTSTFLMTQAAVPAMQGKGVVLNFASQAGRDGGGPGAAAYASAKGAVMTFTRSMAKELGPTGIRVNSLCPGLIGTSFHDRFSKPEGRANVAASTPLRREGNADEVARTAVFLVSDDASFVHGNNVDINGGLFMS